MRSKKGRVQGRATMSALVRVQTGGLFFRKRPSWRQLSDLPARGIAKYDPAGENIEADAVTDTNPELL
jgi:hypothetical protein